MGILPLGNPGILPGDTRAASQSTPVAEISLSNLCRPAPQDRYSDFEFRRVASSLKTSSRVSANSSHCCSWNLS